MAKPKAIVTLSCALWPAPPAGADPKARDEGGETPLHVAATASMTSVVVEALLEGRWLYARRKTKSNRGKRT